MKIDAIYVSCFRYDIHFTRICVASIRFWYPQIAIWLVKDETYGPFDTTEIERAWNVRVFPSRLQNLGWGFGKLQVMFQPEGLRCLSLDSDIVFVGRVLDALQQYDEDFVVAQSEFTASEVEQQFFPVAGLQKLDPEFKYFGNGFNGGQIVATTGKLRREDFDPFMDWGSASVKYPQTFRMGDQGLTNYVILKKVREGRASLRRLPFMIWPGKPENSAHVRIQDLNDEGPHQQLVHWAGLGWGRTLRTLEEMPRADLLLHFEKVYYSKIAMGTCFRAVRNSGMWLHQSIIEPGKKIVKRWLPKTRAGNVCR